MKDDRIIHLVNGEIDGVITPSEQSELTTLIETDPEVRSLRDDLRSLDRILASVPEAEPPARLRANIMDAVRRHDATVRASSRKSWIEDILAPFFRRPAMAVAYAFSIGLIAGLAVFSVVRAPGADSEMVRGTIVDGQPVIGSSHLIVGSTTADVTVKRAMPDLRIDIDVASTEFATLSITPSDGDPIVIESAPGTPSYSLLIPPSSTIRIDVSTDEGVTSDEMTIPNNKNQ